MLNRLKRPPETIVPLFHKIFERPHAIKKHTNAPLLEERLIYLQYWENNGAFPGTLRILSYYLLIIIDYMKFYQIRKVGLDEITEAADKWSHQASLYRRQNTYSKSAKTHFVKDALGWFKSLGCLMLPEEMTLPFADQLNQYMTLILLQLSGQ